MHGCIMGDDMGMMSAWRVHGPHIGMPYICAWHVHGVCRSCQSASMHAPQWCDAHDTAHYLSERDAVPGTYVRHREVVCTACCTSHMYMHKAVFGHMILCLHDVSTFVQAYSICSNGFCVCVL